MNKDTKTEDPRRKITGTASGVFTFQFSLKDTEALEWFDAQPDKGQYLKGLILADKQRQIQGTAGKGNQ